MWPKALKRKQEATDEEAKDAKAAKAPRRAASAKWDKNTPLPRSPTPRSSAALGEGSRMLRLLSLNVAGLRSVLKGEKAQTLRALVERELPDVLCLNEHKLKEEDVEEWQAKLKELLPKEYATVHWTCSTAKKGYSGVAILLRTPEPESGSTPPVMPDPAKAVVTTGMGDLGEGDSVINAEGRLLTLELPELTVVAVYVPNSGIDLARLAYRTDSAAERCWDRTFSKYVQQLQARRGLPVVVIGDLNCCHRVQDIWNMAERPDFPEGLAAKPIADQYTGLSALKKFAGLTPEERTSFGKLLEEAGLVDTFRSLYPDAAGVFSYFSQRVVQNRPLNRGLRLDYVLATSDLCGALAPRVAKDAHKDASDANAPSDAQAKLPDEIETSKAELRLPRVHESFILDQDELVADHAAVGCHILLPPLS